MLFEPKKRFTLSENFIDNYKGKQPNWGELGYITYKRTYARELVEYEGQTLPLPDYIRKYVNNYEEIVKQPDWNEVIFKHNKKAKRRTEEFWETLKRVIEGCYTIQRTHCFNYNLEWNAHKAQHSAQKMFDLMWNFKFLPPGRGIQHLGKEFIWERGQAWLLNCAFVSTKDINFEYAEPFRFLMDFSLCGVGVGFDTRGAGKLKIVRPKIDETVFVVEDSKEGWVDIVARIINAYFGKETLPKSIDYSKIRPEGCFLLTSEGYAPGPGPLIRCLDELRLVFENRLHSNECTITSADITDLMNIIGKCTVSGGIRRSSEVTLGFPQDDEFLTLKSDPSHPWRWASNNSVITDVGLDYKSIFEKTKNVAEIPGFFWLENAKKYGRMKDGINYTDSRVLGVNPCLLPDAPVLTENGIKKLIDLQTAKNSKNPDKIWDGKKFVEVEKVWLTGTKSVYEYVTDNGIFYSTKDHKIYSNGNKIEVHKAKSIDILPKPNEEKFNSIKSSCILSVNYIGEYNVYDITVNSDEHWFWCYGFKVSNCAEQMLEDRECCNLTETFPSNHETLDDYINTLKYAYLYGKTITLLPTHEPRTNAIQLRNRRMGISQSGIVENFQKIGKRVHFLWCDEGYKYLKNIDKVYSEWLCVRESIKISTVKPSGSVSLLPGTSAGIHYPISEYYFKTMRIQKTSPLVKPLIRAGYTYYDNPNGEGSYIFYFPCKARHFYKSEKDVNIWEQISNVAQMQKYWSDNSVSCTIKYQDEEESEIPIALELFEDQLKTISFLKHFHAFEHAPLIPITKEEYEEAKSRVKEINFNYVSTHEVDEKYCDGDKCVL